MGDHGNIRFKQEHGDAMIYLYTHWGGSELPAQLQAALKSGKERWGDEPYLTRYIVGQVTKDHADKLTGFGLSTYPCDNEHDVLEVDCGAQKIRVINSEGFHDPGWEKVRKIRHEFTFVEFVGLSPRLVGKLEEDWNLRDEVAHATQKPVPA